MDRDHIKHLGESVLLLRPRPEEGEAWGGYLMRLASENQFSGLNALTSFVGASPRRALADAPTSFLARLGIPWSGSPVVEPLRDRCTDKRVSLCTSGRSLRYRACGQCLASDATPFIRAAWEHPLTITCELHSAMLLDECKSCRRPLDYRTSSMPRGKLHCRCGASVADQLMEPAAGWTRTLQHVFAEALLGDATPTFAVAAPLAQAAARICYWLVEPVDPQTGKRRRKFRDGKAFLTAATAVSLSPLLQDWPRAMAQAVRCDTDPTKWKGYEMLTNRLAVRRFAKMREVVMQIKASIKPEEKTWSAKFKGKLRRKPAGTYGIKDLMKLTGHSYGGLLRSIEEGLIPGAVWCGDDRAGRKRFDIPANVFADIEARYARTNDVSTAAAQLGCSEDAIRGLVRAKYLRSESILASGFSYRLRPQEVETFAKELFQIAVYLRAAPSVSRVYFSAWVPGPYNTKCASRWKELLRAIHTRRLRVFSATRKPGTLNELYLIADDLEQLFRKNRLKE